MTIEKIKKSEKISNPNQPIKDQIKRKKIDKEADDFEKILKKYQKLEEEGKGRYFINEKGEIKEK